MKNVVKESNDVRICVLQRGNIIVGRFERDGNECVVRDASVIRRWGTTKGLGELVNGPTERTILDKAGVVRFNYLTMCLSIDCEVGKWISVL